MTVTFFWEVAQRVKFVLLILHYEVVCFQTRKNLDVLDEDMKRMNEDEEKIDVNDDTLDID